MEKIIFIVYHIILLSFLVALSFYDYKHLMLSKKLFYWFIPVSILSIVPNILIQNLNIGFVLSSSVISALILYVVFFVFSLVTRMKLGGGDVKIIPFIGFAYGFMTSQVLLFMSISMIALLIAVLIHIIISKAKGIPKEEYKKSKLFGPYPVIPFMTFGCLITSIILFINL